MIKHCNMKIEPDTIWFLEDNDGYTKRRLEIATCPVCGNSVCRESYTRISDGNRFSSYYSSKHALKRQEQLKKDVVYRTDQMKLDNALRGFVYGENRERMINGERVMIQRAVDWFGTKKKVKEEILG